MTLSYRYLVLMPMMLQAAYWGILKVALPILPSLPKIFDTSDHALQLIVALSFILSGLSPLFWGPLIDSMKFRRFILLSIMVGIALLIVTSTASDIYIFGVFYILGCIVACALTLCARSFPFIYFKDEDQIKKSMSLLIFGGYTGAFLSPYISGWVSAAFGWRYAFSVIVVWMFLIFLMVRMLKEDDPVGDKRHFLSNIKNMFQHFKRLSFRKSLLLFAVVNAIGQSYIISIPFWLSRVHDIPPQNIANYLFPLLLPGMVLPFFSAYLSRRFFDKFLMCVYIFIFMAAGVLCFVLYLITNVPLWAWVIPGVLVNITCVGIFPILSFNMFQNIKQNISAASGLVSLVCYTAGGIGMYISIYIGLDTFYLEGAFILLMGAVFYFVMRTMFLSR